VIFSICTASSYAFCKTQETLEKQDAKESVPAHSISALPKDITNEKQKRKTTDGINERQSEAQMAKYFQQYLAI